MDTKYYWRYRAGPADIKGPATIAEIHAGLRSGTAFEDVQLIPAVGQTHGQLKFAANWTPLPATPAALVVEPTPAAPLVDEHGQPFEVRCPACAEPILSTARKCKHCGEWLPSAAVGTAPGVNASASGAAAASVSQSGGGAPSAPLRPSRPRTQNGCAGCLAASVVLVLVFATCFVSGTGSGTDKTRPAVSSPVASTGTTRETKPGYVGCLTKSGVDRVIELAKDAPALARYLTDASNGCTVLKPNLRVTVEESSWGLVRVRLAGETVSFWTIREAVE